ncbi:MAG: HipA domain-containing protein [Lachnospiraceae bacterium]|jgi:serine/threonine-protein kinase HipA|nr:HipA domain-containing protein [Lachnospiraceae bacterium]MEE3461207.1 HipA domain-containing protein [Lachnospiraceae bacterium]
MRSVIVYLNADIVGTLTEETSHGNEVYSFDFDKTYLKNHPTAYFGPDIENYAGKQYKQSMFGCFSDCAPDRWGRTLIQLSRPGERLTEMDYLLHLSDYLRTGAFRFYDPDTDAFLESDGDRIPPMLSLRELEQASYDIENGTASDSLRRIIVQGSSLGGARPKANVIDEKNDLWIAKFPSKTDTYDVGAWEAIENELARVYGLNVPETKAVKLSDHGTTFLSRRFDRDHDTRIPYFSAMTMLGAADGNPEHLGYYDILDLMEAIGDTKDIPELYRRIIFSMLTSNTDDHLRNHGFLMINNEINLSPVFDINPAPDGWQHAMYRQDGLSTIQDIIEVHELFHVDEHDAKEFAAVCRDTIKSKLPGLCDRYQIPKAQRNKFLS